MALDVKGAYPSVDLEVLYHEMKLVGVPGEIIEWMKRRYAYRKNRILFDDFASDPFEPPGGLNQGDAFVFL